jgi:tetratricopeptide (TPR) repeat protein
MKMHRPSVSIFLLVLVVCCSCASRIKGIEKSPVSTEDRTRAHRLLLEGDQLIREQKDHLALRTYVEASTLNPYDEVVFNKLAIAYSRLLMFRESEAAIERSIRLNREYAYAYNTKGITALAQDQLKKAAKSFRRAIALNPQPLFYFNLGTTYLQMEKYEEGRSAFQQALKLNPNVFEMEGAIQVETRAGESNADRHFKLAAIFAELGAKEACLDNLAKAFNNGFEDRNRLNSEPAFAQLRSDPDFIRLIELYGMN